MKAAELFVRRLGSEGVEYTFGIRYRLIEWKQLQPFGAKGYRIERAEELLPTLKRAPADNTVTIIDCPVDYSENLTLTAKPGEMVCPI